MKKFQIFTPSQYVEQMLDSIDYQGDTILKKYFLENSVGEGNILLIAVERYIRSAQSADISPRELRIDLEQYFIGYEVDKSVINSCISKLNHLVLKYGLKDVKWDIRNEDYLKSNLEVQADYIVGNPPYITYQELLQDQRQYLKANFLACKRGKFDYCYAFIEKSMRDLSKDSGKMAYLIPNSIFKNVFAQNLRDMIVTNIKNIIDYKHTHIFGNVLTSSAIIIIDNSEIYDKVFYNDIDNNAKFKIDKKFLCGQWYFGIDSRKYESDFKFGDLFKVANSVATLLNRVFVIPNDLNIEDGVVRPAASPRRLSKGLDERIIFPYAYVEGQLKRYSVEEFKKSFPKAFDYLKDNMSALNKRKSDGRWFEYGRSQGLHFLNQRKLMISSVITEKVNVYDLDDRTIPYSGFYIIPTGDRTLEFAKQILESEGFYKYIETRAINASGKSLRISVNDIKNYPIKL
ncbi:Eco57I restriction-modification methylase domain-containing protein [Streptococcus cristatus]|uniref:Eco57I restriction-modification methylase domain-containing protein n=1 Tax=Streptococcus cristatus TaxID=45634 RepID=UPI0028D088D9|nr:N-6 DNA methylase [Streptococcus cristatus]